MTNAERLHAHRQQDKQYIEGARGGWVRQAADVPSRISLTFVDSLFLQMVFLRILLFGVLFQFVFSMYCCKG